MHSAQPLLPSQPDRNLKDRLQPLPQGPDRRLRWAAIAFAIAVAVHGLDHLRRGVTASPKDVMVAGSVQAVVVLIVVVMALMGHRRSPDGAIVVGFGSALLFAYAHVLPAWWHVLSDSFVSMPHVNATWFSWLTAACEIGTGIVFGVSGTLAKRRPVRSDDERSQAGSAANAT